MSPAIIVIIVLGVVFLALVASFAFLRRLADDRERAARERFPDARLIVRGANFFGQQSSGVLQGRGNGTLVLTDSELFFERWVLRKEYHIPLTAVESVETANSFLGKSIFQPLLKVNFRNDAGQPDAIAWYVPDLVGTKQAIEAAMRQSG
jgi:hypothetical protein